MARNRGKKSLYEVMSKARLKPGYGKATEQPPPEQPDEEEPTTETTSVAKPEGLAQWWRKPRVVQFNAGRIEFSIPYQLAVAVFLGLILLVLAVFRLGQFTYLRKQGTVVSDEEIRNVGQGNETGREAVEARKKPGAEKKILPGTEKIGPAKSTGNNVIVLVEYKARADLVPVQEHFAGYGIETEIVLENGRYFLVTKDRYKNPSTAGTDGYKVLQKIKEVGAKYKGKAPEGYETFAPNFFSDAYGKKVN